MTKKDAAKLLELIQLSYPSSYKDTDDVWRLATINMWQMSFPDVPYPIMEQAFNHHRMVSKFPPTVAEMVAELKAIYYKATEQALVFEAIGEAEEVQRYMAIREYTRRYKDDEHFRGLQMASLQKMLTNGGGNDAKRLTAPGD